MTKPICISCKFFRMKNSTGGTCRVSRQGNGDKVAERPKVLTEHSCEKWRDSGQQYYVRLGWIKAQDSERIQL